MKNFLMKIAYNGSAFHGWQVQPNGVTVQQAMQDAIEKITTCRSILSGCSRTDAGVHANEFYCNFKSETKIESEKLRCAMNAVLPKSIVVLSCEEVMPDFHARFNCKSKEYIYKIWNSENRNPFYQGLYLDYKRYIDCSLIDICAKDYIGTYDFSAFCSSKTETEDHVRTVIDAGVTRNGNEVIFRVEADGFLYNMVRIMVGTLLEISEGKILKNSIPDIINKKDRNLAGRTAPPYGLYLNKVKY